MGIGHVIKVERDHFGNPRRDAKFFYAGQREAEKAEIQKLTGNKQGAKPRCLGMGCRNHGRREMTDEHIFLPLVAARLHSAAQ